ncbi:MAG: BREX-1 system adenine-specific DNA-methyltransferase PglX, partial [Cetobacterium sp.]
MNKSSLKTFAIESRRELMSNIERTLNLLGISRKGVTLGKIMGEKVEIEGKLHNRRDYDTLLKKYHELGYDELVEETAYTWFNRLTALTYMEINGYVNDGLIFSSTSKIAPDIIDSYNDAQFFQNFSDEKKEKVHILRDEHKLEELYSIFVEGKSVELSNIMPFMFSKESELLFPTGLLMEDSFLVKLRKEMTESKEEDGLVPVEIIGWLYQFYNSEKKDLVFEGLKKNQKITKENIPAATQLFTPKWIVKYMVENSLGKLGVESLGVSENLKSKWKYYIESEVDITAQKLKLEDIKIIDPAMGSGHMLTYSFDLLADIYEDAGWGKKDAVLSILKNNIFGLEIDERAGQLASFALMMKGRERFPRLFKVLERLEEEEKFGLKTLTISESNNISQQTKNLMSENNLKNLNQLLQNFEDAKEYGSILKLEKLENLAEEFENLKMAYDKIGQTSLFNSSMEIMDRWNVVEDFEKIEKLIEQQGVMTEKFDVVVTNPPYMGGKGYTEALKKYVEKNYKD